VSAALRGIMRCCAIAAAFALPTRRGHRAASSIPAPPRPPAPPLPHPLLTRDFIWRALYAPGHGYFGQAGVVATASGAQGGGGLPFSSMLGRAEYRHALAAAYAASPLGWMTPVEVFAPWYSRAIARYLLAAHAASPAPSGPLLVWELGGGSGTHARAVLDYLRHAAPRVYASVEYTLVEISPAMAARQVETVTQARAGPEGGARAPGHARALRSLVADATRLQEVAHDGRPCFVLGLEVLDNLPHDKVVALEGRGLCETWVEEVEAEAEGAEAVPAPLPPPRRRRTLQEVYRPLADADIAEVYRFSAAARPPPPPPRLAWARALARALPVSRARLLPPPPPGLLHARYVPTGALRLLRALRAALPAHRLLLADFDALPPPAVAAATVAADARVLAYAPAEGAPLTASKDAATRRTRDHATYMSAEEGTADIFFPTDFAALAAMAAGGGGGGGAGAGGRPVTVQPSAHFLAAYAEVDRTRTLTGFNPLLEDYTNTRVLLT
jgi:hypothetical protein